MSLTALVARELGTLLTASELTYEALDKFIIGKRTQIKGVQRTIKVARNKIGIARSTYNKLASNGTRDFSLDNMLLLQNSILSLEEALPDQNTTSQIIEVLNQSLNRHRMSELYEKIRSGLPYSVQLGTLASLSAFYLESNLAGVIYGSSAAVGLREMFSKKDSIRGTIWANTGNLVGALALILNHDSNWDSYQNNLFFMTVVSHYLTFFQGQLLFRYGYTKSQYNRKALFLQNIRLDFDNLMRSGAIIPEAVDNLRYVGNIRRRERRPNKFGGQIARLESTLIDYFQGRLTLDDVIAARIKYTPKVEYKPKAKRKVSRPAAKPEIISDEEVPSRSRYQPEKTPVDVRHVPTEQYEPPVQVTVALSPHLNDIYDTRQQIGGYSIRPLIDLTRVKIERNPNGEVIKDSGTGRYLLRRLRSSHDLPSNLTVFKMQPIGSLRALYTMQNNNVTILQIMTHPEYDRAMNS